VQLVRLAPWTAPPSRAMQTGAYFTRSDGEGRTSSAMRIRNVAAGRDQKPQAG
jgi:hypothetical protein